MRRPFSIQLLPVMLPSFGQNMSGISWKSIIYDYLCFLKKQCHRFLTINKCPCVFLHPKTSCLAQSHKKRKAEKPQHKPLNHHTDASMEPLPFVPPPLFNGGTLEEQVSPVSVRSRSSSLDQARPVLQGASWGPCDLGVMRRRMDEGCMTSIGALDPQRVDNHGSCQSKTI